MAVDPKYFDWGGAFLGGLQQAHEGQRRNALLDLENRQYGLQERRLNMAEQQMQAEAQNRAREESIGRKALVKDPSVFQDLGVQVDPNDPEIDDLYAALAERYGNFPMSQKGPGQLYQVQGEGGPMYATAQQAIGQRPYKDPREKGVGQLYQVTGPDGKPRYVTAEQALGQQPFVKGSDKPPPDPAAQAQDVQNVISAIDNATRLIGANTTGFIGQKLGGIGGTEAYDLRAALDTVKASIGFDRLQRMREESKTGGALGQVAVRELELLQATIASLDANQSGSQLRANLGRVRAQYERAMKAYQAAISQSGAPAQKESSDGWSIEPVE